MIILNKNYKLAKIEEIGEDDVVISHMDKEYIVHLTKNNKEAIYNLVTDQGMFTVAFDLLNNKLLLDTHTNSNEETLYDIYMKEQGGNSL